MDMSKQIASLNGIISQTQKDAQQATKTITDAVQLFEDVSDLGIDSIIQLIKDGKLNSIAQLAGNLKAAQQLPKVIDTLQDNLAKLPELVAQVAQRGPAFADSLQTLFTRNWISDYAGDEASANRISEGMFNAQKLLAGMIPQATQLWSSVEWLTNSVGAVAGGGKVGVDVQVASYQRWTTGWFDMPCLTTGKYTFRAAGFSSTVNYPKVSRPVIACVNGSIRAHSAASVLSMPTELHGALPESPRSVHQDQTARGLQLGQTRRRQYRSQDDLDQLE